jgi:hypothetical protein
MRLLIMSENQFAQSEGMIPPFPAANANFTTRPGELTLHSDFAPDSVMDQWVCLNARN